MAAVFGCAVTGRGVSLALGSGEYRTGGHGVVENDPDMRAL